MNFLEILKINRDNEQSFTRNKKMDFFHTSIDGQGTNTNKLSKMQKGKKKSIFQIIPLLSRRINAKGLMNFPLQISV